MRKSVLELMLSVMARSLSQDSKTVTMPPRHIYNYKREGTSLVGRLLAPTPSRVRQQWRTEGLGLTAAFGIAGRLDSDDLRIGGGIFERPVDRSLTVVVIVVVDGEIWAQPVFGDWPPGRRATIRWALLVI